MDHNAELLNLKSRIQVLETLLKYKDQELQNAQDTLNRVLNLTKVAPNMTVSDTVKVPAELRLIPESHLLMRGDSTVSLTAREFVILNHLYTNKEKACTREELLDNFKESPDMTSRNIDVHIFSLRKKLNKVDMGVETVWGIGYKMIA